jgi:signal peptidase I
MTSSSGLRGHRRTYLTILESADYVLFKMVRYVLLRPLRPELDVIQNNCRVRFVRISRYVHFRADELGKSCTGPNFDIIPQKYHLLKKWYKKYQYLRKSDIMIWYYINDIISSKVWYYPKLSRVAKACQILKPLSLLFQTECLHCDKLAAKKIKLMNTMGVSTSLLVSLILVLKANTCLSDDSKDYEPAFIADIGIQVISNQNQNTG